MTPAFPSRRSSYRAHELRVIVPYPLQAGDMADRTQGGGADLADALGNGVGRTENLGCLLVQHQMIVAKMGTRDVPVEVLGIDVELVTIRQHGRASCRERGGKYV